MRLAQQAEFQVDVVELSTENPPGTLDDDSPSLQPHLDWGWGHGRDDNRGYTHTHTHNQ